MNKDSNKVCKLMNNLANKGGFNVDKKIIKGILEDFDSGAVTDKDAVTTMGHFYIRERSFYVLIVLLG